MTDLFDQVDLTPRIDETKNYFEELVGDGKKFKDAVDLAKGKAFADAHIINLETTLAGLREELKTRKTAEDLINQIALANRADPIRTAEPPVFEENTDQTKSLSPADVEKMFAEREARLRKESNLNLTTQKLRDAFGDNAQAALQAKANELGLDTNYLKNMAQEAPSAFLSLFQKPTETKEVFNAPPASSFRTAPDTYTGPKWSDFNKVKTADPVKYWSSAFQREIMNAAERAMSSGDSVYEKFMNS